MEKDDNYSNEAPMPPSFSSHHHHQHDLYNNQDQFMRSRPFETSADNATGILTYFPANPLPPPPLQSVTSPDKLSFAEVMQFADFGPKLSLNRFDEDDEPAGIDPVYFLKFPVLNNERAEEAAAGEEEAAEMGGRIVGELEEEENFRNDKNGNNNNNNNNNNGNSNKRKRGRTVKTSEEVESQRMTHIAVERNRRKQMNEHLRVLRSLMPGSYVQRGDQASIIGGAIEFVRELEQLLQCLESQKRRRLLGEPPLQAGDTPPPQQPPFLPPGAGNFGGHQNEGQILETTAESKSCLADVEVKVLGFDAMIKILSRRRPGQLIKAIAALEDLQLNILHTNITTIEQTVLYSFNVKIASESRFTAEDIASSVQQIFGFIHANTGM
ncbi:transcription factor FAMA [Cucurbita moschata]|uniref:Transcription factor FAMA n=1 Tax=Cucurbita moschata TaxID=3662 RepID=A0A6J1E8R4_CUCMO|nr:transcription factor FAMA [Cucurbita moschata]XP_022924299.1 transcription factor FAMA [Cucurbita moschata]